MATTPRRPPEQEWARLHLAQARLSRRDLLAKCAALGVLVVAPSLSLAAALDAWDLQEPRRPTPWNELGPFYRKGAPRESRMRRPGDPGLPLVVSGRVLDTRGEIVPGATIEIWHTNHAGQYDLTGYHFRAGLTSDTAGSYAFDSIMPGHYPSRVCQHVHYLVRAPGHKPLTTQLYFATDPVFEGNPDRNYTKDPLLQSRELVRPVLLESRGSAVTAAVSFELVLDRA
jgi:protocatechuate 3,4-dioxygenase beta subunit